MSTSFYRTSKGRLLFGLRGRITRTDFWVGLIALVGITTLAVLLGGNRGLVTEGQAADFQLSKVNTNELGGREGIGVFARTRPTRQARSA
jgi:uncharacterized membrane protein YhaH (DUF805 family)